MRDRILLASLLLILLAPIAAAADDPGLPAGATVVHLVERAERVLPRDEIVAVLRADAMGKAPLDVQAEVNRRMAAALDEAKKSAAVKIATPSMSVYANRDSKDGTVTWTATQSLRLESKDVAAALVLVGKLEGQQLAVSSLGFTVSPEALAGVQDPLTTEALQRLRKRAEAVASDLGLAFDRIKTVTVGNAEAPGPQPRLLMTAKAEAVPAPAAEPGEAPVGVAVDAEVVLLPKH